MGELSVRLDLLRILDERLGALSAGDHTFGLKAVLSHVSVAVAHLERGRRTGDETAFTDAIYRTNQAFEGSLKEAYRVLTSKDPDRTTPAAIESYLQDNKTLRPRIVTQLTRYRTEWRNPSTHDYRLDFDEDEALLAIVSVCALAIVLSDQMAETLGFQAVKATRPSQSETVSPHKPLVVRIVDALLDFDRSWLGQHAELSRESAVVGAVHAYLEAALPEVEVLSESKLEEGRHLARPDLLVRTGEAKVVIEVKALLGRRRIVGDPIAQLAGYLLAADTTEGILYVPGGEGTEPVCYEQKLATGGTIFVVAPSFLRDPSP